MSYSQRFHESITVHGSKTVSYPKSESGGSITVSYSETVPIDVTIDVETAPFDSSVSHCNYTIDGLTGSVVAMNAAQVAAIRQTTKEVSQTLIDGFFGTITTELSQQLQALDSAVKAVSALMTEQGKAVSSQKNTMETDYNRISSRYVSVFQDLDNECYKRIYALDKNAFNLALNVEKKLIAELTANNGAKSLLCALDESASKSMILISRINRITRDVLSTLKNYVNQELRISSLLSSFMTDEPITGMITEYVPLIWTSADAFEGGVHTGGENTGGVSYTPAYLPRGHQERFVGAGRDYFASLAEAEWKDIPEPDKKALDKELLSIAEPEFAGKTDAKDIRVYTMMMELWQKSAVKTAAKNTANMKGDE